MQHSDCQLPVNWFVMLSKKPTSMNVKYVTANGLINAFLIQMTATAAGIENYCIKKTRTGVKL